MKIYKSKFEFCRNEFLSAMAKICLTVRFINQTETIFVGHSELIILNGKVIA